MRKLKVDMEGILDGMNADPMMSPRWYLDLDTGGTVLEDDEGMTEDEVDLAADPDRYRAVPRASGADDYQLMSNFAAQLEDEDIRERLALALDGRGAFGRFRRVLHDYPDLLDRWYDELRARHIAEAEEWLRGLGIEPEYELLERPEPASATDTPGRSTGPQRARIGLLELLLLGAPDGKTELIGGKVQRLIIARSPSEARATFKDVAGDVCAYHGVGWRKRFVQGKNRFTMEDFELSVHGDRVELARQISGDLWSAFQPSNLPPE